MSPCEGCHAGCCRSFAVPITGADILRIERDLKLDFWDFVCRWEDPSGQIARNYAPQFHFADEPDTPFVICLTHSASENFPGTSKCQFLKESPPTPEFPLGKASCGIYGTRPSACRAFPAKFNETEELAVIYDIPPSGRDADQHHQAYELCPRPWEPADFDPLDVMSDLAIARFEMKFFHQLALLWNNQPQEWGLFPEFLKLVYASRVTREVTETPQVDREIIPFPQDDDQGTRRAA